MANICTHVGLLSTYEALVCYNIDIDILVLFHYFSLHFILYLLSFTATKEEVDPAYFGALEFNKRGSEGSLDPPCSFNNSVANEDVKRNTSMNEGQ